MYQVISDVGRRRGCRKEERGRGARKVEKRRRERGAAPTLMMRQHFIKHTGTRCSKNPAALCAVVRIRHDDFRSRSKGMTAGKKKKRTFVNIYIRFTRIFGESRKSSSSVNKNSECPCLRGYIDCPNVRSLTIISSSDCPPSLSGAH